MRTMTIPLETQVKREQNKVYRLRVQVQSADRLIKTLQQKLLTMDTSNDVRVLQTRYNVLSEAYNRLISQHNKLQEQYVDLNEMFHDMMQKMHDIHK